MAKGDKSKKVSKGKKDKQPEQPPVTVAPEEVLTEVERTFFQLTIADIKRKILRLRAHIQNLGIANEAVTKEIHGLKVEKKGQAGELTNKVDEIHDKILKLRSENAKLTEAYNNEKRRSEATIGDLELKYKAMHDQLSSDIKRLNGKLNACEEFRINRDNWVIKFNERADELADKELEAKELFRQMEAKSVYEREVLKEDLLSKLTLAGEEFTGAGAVSTTGTTDLNLRLIRENIALQKNIDMLVNSNNEMDARMQQELALYESNKTGIPELEKRNRQLIEESQEKLNVIKEVTDQVQKLKQEYIAGMSYREQNISIKEFQICARFRRQKLHRLVNQVGRQLNAMEREVNLYDYLAEQYKAEREKIAEHLENSRVTIERSIGVTNVRRRESRIASSKASSNDGDNNSVEKLYSCGNLLHELVELLQSDFDLLDTGRRASLATIKPYEKLTRFDALFKKEAPSLTSLMDLCVAYIDSDAAEAEMDRGSASIITIGIKALLQYEAKEYETIFPAQRPLGKNYIFDVESGTSLYYSSEPEDLERIEVQEDDGVGGDEEEESSDSDTEVPPKAAAASVEAEATAKKKLEAAAAVVPSEVSSGINKLPPGTIVDVVTEEEYEEFDERDYELYETTFDEDEEYDINLFY